MLALVPSTLLAVTIGQTDDFEDGTTQGWVVGLLGAVHPAPPSNVSTGGPAGVDDNYLLLTSLGGQGAGSRLAVINFNSQWAGDYSAAGVNAIRMSLLNLGNSDLNIRLVLEDPTVGPPENVAVTDSVFLAAGSGWVEGTFSLDASDLTGLLGDVTTLLANVTALRIIHNPDPTFPGPPIAAQLGVDNITAAQVPEPASVSLIAGGIALLAIRGRLRG